MDLKLKNKVILVAASSKGIGLGIAKALAKEGAILHLGSRNLDQLNKITNEIKTQYKTEVSCCELDVTSIESIKHWTLNALELHTKIDGIVINAGGPPAGNFEACDEEKWHYAFNLTLMSAVRMIKEVLPVFKKQNSGTILAVSSSSVIEPIEGLLLSNVFRSGVQSLIKTLSRELAKDGIRINSIIPGRIDTDRVKELDQIKASKFGKNLEEQQQAEANEIPLGRYGTVYEFGSCAAFLMSEQASYVTGTMFAVDGGKVKSV